MNFRAFFLHASLLFLSVLLSGRGPLSAQAQAQTQAPFQTPVARLTRIQQTVQVRPSAAASFKVVSRSGAPIGRGSTVRTLRRSKADVTFADGSLVRLGQLSSLTVNGPRQVKVEGGTALISWLRSGRVSTGYAAAEIKGTVARFEASPNGDIVALYEGALEVVSSKGRRELRPGTEVTIAPDGSISALRPAPALFHGRSGAPLELATYPQEGTFVGSVAERVEKNTPGNVLTREFALNTTRNRVPTRPSGFAPTPAPTSQPTPNPTPQPTTAGTPQPTSVPIPVPTPQPTTPGAAANVSGSNVYGGKRHRTSGQNATVASEASGAVRRQSSSFASSVSRSLQQLREIWNTSAASAAPVQNAGGHAPVVLAQASGAVPPSGSSSEGDLGREGAVLGDVAQDAGEGDFNSRRAQAQINELRASEGVKTGLDARAVGLLADGGNAAYGARLSGFVSKGPFTLRGAVRSLDVEADGRNFDLSAVSDLSLLYRAPRFETEIGRQRFLGGPTQATLYGSLVRQGARETMDAVRIAGALDREGRRRLEVAYLYDAYPHKLPYTVGGRQEGYYARYSSQGRVNLGVNLLGYSDLDTPSTLGASLDFATTLSQAVSLYGEAGRDPFERPFGALGLTFPRLYDRTGVDVYFEVAELGSSDLADGEPTEFALRAYRRISDNLDFIGSVSHFSNGETAATIGLSLGTRLKKP